MFFFGSLSTILPYLLYIFIVWICILIGSRSQIFPGLFSSNGTEQNEIINSEEISSEENCYIVKIQVDEELDCLNELILQKNIFALFHPEIQTMKYLALQGKIYETDFHSGNSLRGPPYILS